jgi:hypothetical protein
MRSANLARAVTAVRPEASVLVLVASDAAGAACGDVPWVAGDAAASGVWRQVVRGFRPTLAVFDTALPGTWADDATRQAFVWRATVPAKHAETAADARLRRMAAIVVPHDRDEFPGPVPDDLADRVIFAGPIVRGSDAAGQARVRERYGLAPEDAVITSTVGGGGFEASAAWLLRLVFDAHRHWHDVPRLKHLVVRGPLASGDLPGPPPGVTVVEADPDLVHLFALSRLVIAEAGYNTVHELRHLGVPALFAPGPRTWDDQVGRARAAAALGVAHVVDRARPDAALGTLVALARDPRALAAMREAAARHPLATGNHRAATALIEAAS